MFVILIAMLARSLKELGRTSSNTQPPSTLYVFRQEWRYGSRTKAELFHADPVRKTRSAPVPPPQSVFLHLDDSDASW